MAFQPILFSGFTTGGSSGGGGSSPTIGGTVVGGTNKSVLFIGAGSTLSQDNSNFNYDSVTHNLTITGLMSALNLSGSSSGTNTGDVTIGTASGLSLAGQVLSLQLATTSLSGALSSTDWNTFNNKQPAGSYVLTSQIGAANGVASLDVGGKVPVAQLPSTVMIYKGAWDASTNTPTLADGTGTNGWVYRASVAGTQDLGSGSQTWGVGDFAIYNGSIWQHSPAADGVSSVNGLTGAVTLTQGNLTEATSSVLTITGGTNSVWGSGTSIQVGQSTTSTSGFLSSTDWNTFNTGATTAANSANKTLSNLTSPLAVNQTFLASASNTFNLGSTTVFWNRLYVNEWRDSSNAVIIDTTRKLFTSAGVLALDFGAANIDINTRKIVNVVNPTNPQDAATKAYVDSSVTGGTITAVTASAPLASSGGTTPNITISQSTTSTDGYLSSTDWNTFNNKQAAGSYITALTGDVTASGPGSSAASISSATVTGKLLTGFVSGPNSAVLATDSILQGLQKLQAQVSASPVPGDINQTSFTAADNQVAPADVTGFLFSNASVRSFESQVSIVRSSTYEVFKLIGIQKAASWEMSQDFIGDDAGITFSITSAGQVQYTSTSTGSTALIKFRAQVTSV